MEMSKRCASLRLGFEALTDPLAYSLSLLAVVAATAAPLHLHHALLAMGIFLLAQLQPLRLADDLKTLYRESVIKSVWLIAALLAFSLSSDDTLKLEREVLIGWSIAGPVSAALLRHGVYHLTPRLLACLMEPRHTVIVGASQAGFAIADRLHQSRWSNNTLLGFFDDRQAQRHARPGIARLGSIGDLHDFLLSHRVDEIYIAVPLAREPRLYTLLDEIKHSTIAMYFVPDLCVGNPESAQMDELQGLPLMAVRQ